MLKRDRLKSLLRKISDKEFDAVWKDAYGYLPVGERGALVVEFVAEQYDGELDGSIKRADSLLNPTRKHKTENKWLCPR
jgi:hypothetical protein